MTKQQFLTNFYCICFIQNQGNINLVIVSKAIRRNGSTIVDRVKTSIDISETNNWIVDSQSFASVTPWDWKKLIDQAKRAHLDYFSQRAPIDNYFPLNTIDNPDISEMYK